MCRSITQFFFGFLIVILLIPTVLSTIFVYQGLNQGFYQRGLEQSGIYEALPELISEELDANVRDISVSSEVSDVDIDSEAIRELTGKVLESVVPVIADPVFVQNIVDNNLDNTFKYLNSEVEELYVYIPKQELLRRVNESVDVLFTEVLTDEFNNFSSLEICTADQLQELIDNPPESFDSIPCIPDFAAEDFDIQDLSKVNTDIDLAISEVLDGPDNMEISLFAEQYNLEGYEETEQSLLEARQTIRIVRVGMLFAWAGIALMIAVFLLLSRGDIWHRIQAISVPIAFSGAILGLIGIGAVASVDFLEARILNESLADLPPSLAISMSNLLEYSVNSLLTPIAIIGVVMLVVSVLLIVGLHYMPRTKQSSLEA